MTTNLTPGGNAGKSFPAEVLTPAEVRQLMDACRAGGPAWPWDAGYAVYLVHIASTLCEHVPYPLHPCGEQ